MICFSVLCIGKPGFPVVLTRAANVFGLHQQLYRIIPRTAIYLRLGRTVELHGGGKARRSFVHVRDVARATWLAIQQGRPGEVYHVAPAGEVISIRDLVARVCRLAGGDFARATRMVEENFGQDSLFSLDASKARRELGWEPEVTLDQGIEETVAWVDDNWDTIRTEPLEYVHRH